MSGYPDDPRDFDDPDRRGEPDRRDDEDDVRVARQRVSIPAVGLIVVGALTIFSSGLGLIQLALGVLDKSFEDAIQQIQADPNVPAAQKQEQVQMLSDIRDFVGTYGPAYYAAGLLVGIVVLVGGVRFKGLGSPGLVVASALLAVLPFSACCVLGLVFGIWTITALASPEVKAGFAAKRRLAAAPDSY